MSQLAKLRESIELLEKAERLLCDVQYTFAQGSIERDKVNSQYEVIGDAVCILRDGVLAHVEAGIYQAAQHSVQRIWCTVAQNDDLPNEKMCATCGHSESRHQTAGGFCKHCTCNEFVDPATAPNR